MKLVERLSKQRQIEDEMDKIEEKLEKFQMTDVYLHQDPWAVDYVALLTEKLGGLDLQLQHLKTGGR